MQWQVHGMLPCTENPKSGKRKSIWKKRVIWSEFISTVWKDWNKNCLANLFGLNDDWGQGFSEKHEWLFLLCFYSLGQMWQWCCLQLQSSIFFSLSSACSITLILNSEIVITITIFGFVVLPEAKSEGGCNCLHFVDKMTEVVLVHPKGVVLRGGVRTPIGPTWSSSPSSLSMQAISNVHKNAAWAVNEDFSGLNLISMNSH